MLAYAVMVTGMACWLPVSLAVVVVAGVVAVVCGAAACGDGMKHVVLGKQPL